MKGNWKLGLGLLLFEIGFGISFNLVGVISISEIFLFFFLIFYLRKLQLLYRHKYFRLISNLYLFLLIAQIFSEIAIDNDLNNSVRIWALTIMSYLHLVFLLIYFLKDKTLVLYVVAGLIIKDLIFGSTDVESSSMDEVVAGDGAAFVKFYLARLIIYPILIFAVISSKKKLMSILIILTGLFLVFVGARNDGAFFALSGMVWYFFLSGKRISKQAIISLSLMVGIVGYCLYAIYVSEVLSGNITAGNAWQIKKLDQPYNPMNLLVLGRANFFAGLIAFKDQFFFGHGSWAIDETGKYWEIVDKFAQYERDYTKTGLIPAHSVLIGAATRNGIFACLAMGLILYNFIKTGFKSLKVKSNFNILIIYFVFKLIWDGLFSPIAQFRLTFPLYFSFIIATLIWNEQLLRRKYTN